METIFSLVTNNINQNVGIIRVSGPDAFFVLKKEFPNIKIKENNFSLQKIYDDEKFIDNAIILMFVKPRSFTGEDVFEIQFHGSIILANIIIKKLKKYSVLRQSLPGEFTKQAFLNNKIDLVQSEAINQMIKSENYDLTMMAAQNLDGKQSKFINESISFFENIISKMQVAIDYPEVTDLPKYNLKENLKEIKKYWNELGEIISISEQKLKISSGIDILIFGDTNAGKSTFFNSLLKEDKAIVTSVEGTTRDVVEGTFLLDEIKINLYDTAGIRKTKNIIEKIGISKTNELLNKVDIKILMFDGKKDLKTQYDKYLSYIDNKTICFLNKADKKIYKNKKTFSFENLKVNILDAKNINLIEIKELILKLIQKEKITFDAKNKNILITQNQIEQFKLIYEILENMINNISNYSYEDVIFFDIEQIIHILYKIIGKEIDSEYFTNLFSNFCIGK